MEASERPQLELGDEPDGTVRALGDRIVIEGMSVEDARAARLVRERSQAGTPGSETVRTAIEIGARVLDREETGAEVEFVKDQLREQLGDLGKVLGDTVEETATQMAEALTETFGAERNDSVQAQIKETVTRLMTEQRETLNRTLTAEDGSNPLVAFQERQGKLMLASEERSRTEIERLRDQHGKESRVLQEHVARLTKEIALLLEREDADERVTEAEEAGTRKGFTFEEAVHDAIEDIADSRGDAATHTGATQAEGGGKKGDTVVELGACDGPSSGRIVFEAKNTKQPMSKNEAWRYLDNAIEARAASFGVLIVPGEDRIPSGREQLREYQGNKMIVAVDPDEPDGLSLAIAYRLAAARVSMAREKDLTVDAVEVRIAAEEAISCLKQAQSIRTTLTGINKSSDKARSTLDEMVAAVELKLDRIDALVADAAEESEE